MMELTKDEVMTVVSLINIAWQSGAVRSPNDAQSIEALRQKLSSKKEELTLVK